jgi:hypothetical protein
VRILSEILDGYNAEAEGMENAAANASAGSNAGADETIRSATPGVAHR